MIKAPYNFVPVSEKVFFPDWAKQISHDVPFKDGESGSITVKMTAHSPIYVRNGHKHTDNEDEDEEYISFSKNQKGEYFIPGTSIKGMIRSTLEIMSFGKMGQKKSNRDGKLVEDRRYGFRDLHYDSYTQKMTTKENGKIRSNVKSGWLQKDNNDNWTLNPCQYVRVEITDLEKFYGSTLRLGRKQSSIDKYNKWEKTLDIRFKTKKGPFKHTCGFMEYTKATDLDNGNEEGTIVFTGQASERKLNRKNILVGKHMEFIFYNCTDKPIDINHIKKDFCFIHSNDKGLPNEEWEYWEKKLNTNERVPVFYLEENGRVSSMGLAMMYRLAYNHTVHDLLPENHKKEDLDLAESMFGIEDRNALRGRVQFSIAKAEETATVLNEKTLILGTPRATYYPNYIKQDGTNGVTNNYKTFMDKEAKLKGRKRYPVHKNFKDPVNVPKDKTSTTFVPLCSGTKFNFRIRYHNLKKVELGALLTALTFYGRQNEYFHSIGMAKPLGYGKVQLKLQEINSSKLDLSNMECYMKDFIKTVETELQLKWDLCSEIIELFTMAKEHDNRIDTFAELSYMPLDPTNRINAFTDATNDRQYLMYYSKMNQYGIDPASLKTISDFIEEYKNLSGKDFIDKAVKSHGDEKKAVLLILKENKYNSDWDLLYQKYQTEPYIAFLMLKNIENSNLRPRDIISKINEKHEDFNKYKTVIFDFYFEEILNKKIPDDGFPKYLKPFVYTWNDLIKEDSSEQYVFDIFDNLQLRTWPPKEDLIPYLKSVPQLRVYVDYV